MVEAAGKDPGSMPDWAKPTAPAPKGSTDFYYLVSYHCLLLTLLLNYSLKQL